MTASLAVCLLLLLGSCTGSEDHVRGRPLVAARKPSLIGSVKGEPIAGGRAKGLLCAKEGAKKPPSIFWPLLHNWLYFMSLGIAATNLPRTISTIVNPDGSAAVTPLSIQIKGDVEAVDKLLTFLFVGFLGALSDVVGRRPLIIWSALGFGVTCYLQATTRRSIPLLFLADFIDGMSSCMTTVCQTYVTDVSPPDRRAINLGLFSGLSVGGAFMLAFPLGGVLGQKLGSRAVLKIAAGLQLLSVLIALVATPESKPAPSRSGARLDLRSANPAGSLALLCRSPLLRGSALAYFLVSLARSCLDVQFVNYAAYRFGLGPQQSGPLLVVVGLMLAVVPRLAVPRLGIRLSILVGTLVFAAGQAATALAPSVPTFFASIFLASLGIACVPALTTVITNQGSDTDRGALLGGLGSVTELSAFVANVLYSRIFAFFISDSAPFKFPGAHFMSAAAFLLASFGISASTFARPDVPAV